MNREDYVDATVTERKRCLAIVDAHLYSANKCLQHESEEACELHRVPQIVRMLEQIAEQIAGKPFYTNSRTAPRHDRHMRGTPPKEIQFKAEVRPGYVDLGPMYEDELSVAECDFHAVKKVYEGKIRGQSLRLLRYQLIDNYDPSERREAIKSNE